MDELAVVLKARELVNRVGSTTIPSPIEAYAADVGARLRLDHDLAPDEPGFSIPGTGKYKFHIRVNANDAEERRRFTACHEIAHIVLGLPSEHTHGPWWSYARRSQNEIFCDVFAAELLLPYKLFKPLVDKSDVTFDAIDTLATRFVASLTATGSRFGALSSSPCAFVLSENGAVRYASRSKLLREANAWIPLRMALPKGSISARLHSGGTCDGPEEVAADVWFSSWDRGGMLLEDARHFGRWDQTTTLLSFEDEEVPAPPRDRREQEEEEQGLAELDGSVPWPGKRRRR